MESTSTIGRGTVVRGSVRGEGDLVQSDVSGRRVTVRGAVAGNVSATEAIVLEAGARVVGDLGAPQIGIRPGALVRGMVSTGGTPHAAAAATATATRARPAPEAAAHR